MPDAYLRLAAVWADPDLIEIAVELRFQAWAGASRAYVTRDELRSFAAQLDAVVAGGVEAQLSAGQRDLGYAEFSVREYSMARHLAMDLAIGQAADGRPGPSKTHVQVAVPVERGSLAALASGLRQFAETERGAVTVALPPDWP